MQKIWDTFIVTKLSEVVEDKEELRTIRDVTPGVGKYKYKCKLAKVLISKNPDKYPDKLQVRLGRGQLTSHVWSIKINEEIDLAKGIPTKPYHMSGGLFLEED